MLMVERKKGEKTLKKYLLYTVIQAILTALWLFLSKCLQPACTQS